MNRFVLTLCSALAAALPVGAAAEVSAADAAALKTTLTPAGAEMAGNKDGSIPAYTGGYKEPYAGYIPGGRRPDPFAADKPLFTITQQNAGQYADKLSPGTLELLKRHADYRLDVYKTMRTARLLPEAAERTFQNATQTKLVTKGDEKVPESYAGGFPFPIPKSGEEAMFNHILRVRGDNLVFQTRAYLVTADGKRTMISESEALTRGPTASPSFKAEGWDGTYDMLRINTQGPVIRAGEQLVVRENLDHAKTEIYAYLPGQRRVRRLPSLCCDSPSAATAGIANVDDTSVWAGRLSRFDWKLVGKKELYIPYNTNRFNVPTKDFDVVGERFLNPDHVRWELHRVWVVEASLKSGQRHTSPKSTYYLDEDTWQAVMADRMDAKGQLWKHSFVLPLVFPDMSWTSGVQFGFYDLLSNTFFISNVMNEKKAQVRRAPDMPESTWQPEAMAGAGVR